MYIAGHIWMLNVTLRVCYVGFSDPPLSTTYNEMISLHYKPKSIRIPVIPINVTVNVTDVVYDFDVMED